MRVIVFVFFCFCFSSCTNRYLTIQQEWIDENYLASVHAKTPDPEQKNITKGQKLTIGWDFPKSVFDEELSLNIQFLFWDNTLLKKCHHIFEKRDYISYFFPQEDYFPLLSYQIHVVDKKGKVIQVWTHQLWTELIEES